MTNDIELRNLAADQLSKTSRTFFIPISQLPAGLWEAVSSAYLCMRAIDEIEDHPQLLSDNKIFLLNSIYHLLQEGHKVDHRQIEDLFAPFSPSLPKVTLLLSEWIRLAPAPIANTILTSTATMAKGMAEWAARQWSIRTEEDLDQYTYYVAGLVGILLSHIWKWHAKLETDHELAIAFGRGLQAVNIIRNRTEDMARGVNYFPQGWSTEDMFAYARRNLWQADRYTESIAPGPIYNFCKIPLTLAHATLNTIIAGESKLSRNEVQQLVLPYIGQ